MGRGETNAKKRKRQAEAKSSSSSNGASNGGGVIDTSRPTAVYKPTRGRDWTVSVALPGSIISNAQSHDLRTSMAGNIARALSVFCIDEVIVFSDGNDAAPTPRHQAAEPSGDGYTGTTDPGHFLAHLLSYLETPPHLRKRLFPLHPNLRTAGTLPSLDLPHHVKPEEWCAYREGVTLPGADENGTFVEAGLRIPVTVADEQIPPDTRVTLRFGEEAEKAAKDPRAEVILAEAVGAEEPREEGGYYWGYNVRRAPCLSDVFTECVFEGGYDVSIGTSERGADVETLYATGEEGSKPKGKFKHLLIVLGGVAGLEVAVRNDAELQKLGVPEAEEVFDHWINVCPGQGSRTIRTEEAIWMGLMGLRRLVVNNYDGNE